MDFVGHFPTPQGGRRCLQGKVLPFLLHNLDTGETTMMEKALKTKSGRDPFNMIYFT